MKNHLSITIIDDDETVHYVASVMLKKQKPDVIINHFYDAEEFLRQYNEDFFTSAILLDINMPGMDGWQLLDEFSPKAGNIPVYMCSSSIDVLDRQRCSSYPVVKDYIAKPLTFQKVETLFSELGE